MPSQLANRRCARDGDAGRQGDACHKEDGTGQCELSSRCSRQCGTSSVRLVYFWDFTFTMFGPPRTVPTLKNKRAQPVLQQRPPGRTEEN